jgi:hypothetical protein
VDEALHGFIALPRFSRSLREGYEVINAFLDGADADPESDAHRAEPEDPR